uniref:ATP synthase subunit a n=1 Tax=Berthellina sp. TLT-2006 TaxID=407122 RepID=E6Y139_9GAST|nr:ATP synthase F0 subunit 6 [Berthellina sp. TLT-2006]ABK92225.1 ATP synthase F0 subunit 6 [Berthellina sp. TLT-2006]
MLSDLFSALDCNQAGKLSIFLWAIPLLTVSMFFTSNIWMQTFNKISLSMISLNSQTSQKKLLMLPLVLYALMTLLLTLNILGLVPFVYGPTSNIWVSAALALVLWSSLLSSGWTAFPVESAAHLAPSGAPGAFIPFLVLIEAISILIRPLTLTVRIIANISAGHIIMGLIANSLTSVTIIPYTLILFLHIGYNMFEVFVCVIQAYVFSLLVKLYSEEHPN